MILISGNGIMLFNAEEALACGLSAWACKYPPFSTKTIFSWLNVPDRFKSSETFPI
jgi:hypothetical protein